MTGEDIVVVSCAHPAEGAEELAQALVELRLAACVQILAGVRSTYRWEGSIEVAREVRLEAKTSASRADALVAAIVERHPYDVPEVLVTRVDGGHAPYAAWVRSETSTGS